MVLHDAAACSPRSVEDPFLNPVSPQVSHRAPHHCIPSGVPLAPFLPFSASTFTELQVASHSKATFQQGPLPKFPHSSP